MMVSMTGFGRGEASADGLRAEVEVRSVNSRYLEISSKLPRSLNTRENDLRELVRKKISRGKVNITCNLYREGVEALPLKINADAATAAYGLLTELQKNLGITGAITLEHILHFSEVLESDQTEGPDEAEWKVFRDALDAALDQLLAMRGNEGKQLSLDLQARMEALSEKVAQVERLSSERVPQERVRLQERVQQLLGKDFTVDQSRLELELALLADRLDVTEECVRLQSHIKFFLDAMEDHEPAGRRLNFLLQEMHREINTMGVKSNDAEISHIVVGVKEELERIREQIQNIE